MSISSVTAHVTVHYLQMLYSVVFFSWVRQLYCDQLITERFCHKEILTGEISVSVNIGTYPHGCTH